jgi:hypothetical protein
MTFDKLSDDDLAHFRRQLQRRVQDQALPFGEIQVTRLPDSELLEVTAVVVCDPFLDSSGNAAHRHIRVGVTVFAVSPETDREVLLGKMSYSVEKEHSNFFPVPEDYGDHVTIHFNWEFDRETLESRSAEIRDRESVHYASVLPNPDFAAFIECCSKVAEEWAS